MIAPSRQIPHIESPAGSPRERDAVDFASLRAMADARLHGVTIDLLPKRFMPWLIGLVGFIAFIPYPAISVGHSTAIQIGNMLMLAVLAPALLFSPKPPPMKLIMLITIPLVTSVLKLAFTGSPDLDLALKTLPVWVLHIASVLVTLIYAPRYLMPMLTGIAISTMLHAAIGAYQLYSFRQGVFPLMFLYVNPMFLSIPETADRIVKYIQRPFGLFPEPSAMASSLAPILLLWLGQMCGVIRFSVQPNRIQARLFAGATLSGIALIILSQSGHAAITLAAGSIFLAVWFLRSKATLSTFAAIVGIFGVAMPLVLWLAVESLSNRLTGGGGHGSAAKLSNGSWDERSSSLVYGFQIWTNGSIPDFIFGVGTGVSAAIIERLENIGAVFSVSLTYIYETGLVGLICVGLIARDYFHVWRTSRRDPAFLIVGTVWLVGITVTTSYATLIPIWLIMSLLAIWPAIVDTSPRAAKIAAPPIAPAVGRRGMWLESGLEPKGKSLE